MAVPLQLRILRALRVRLEQISVANGYLTDTGKYVVAGPGQVEKRDCPAAAVIPGGDEKSEDQGRSMRLSSTFHVDHWVAAYPELPGEAIVEQAADIRRAALDSAGKLADDDGDLARLLYVRSERMDSSDGVEGMRQTYLVNFEEAYGDPTRR